MHSLIVTFTKKQVIINICLPDCRQNKRNMDKLLCAGIGISPAIVLFKHRFRRIHYLNFRGVVSWAYYPKGDLWGGGSSPDIPESDKAIFSCNC